MLQGAIATPRQSSAGALTGQAWQAAQRQLPGGNAAPDPDAASEYHAAGQGRGHTSLDVGKKPPAAAAASAAHGGADAARRLSEAQQAQQHAQQQMLQQYRLSLSRRSFTSSSARASHQLEPIRAPLPAAPPPLPPDVSGMPPAAASSSASAAALQGRAATALRSSLYSPTNMPAAAAAPSARGGWRHPEQHHVSAPAAVYLQDGTLSLSMQQQQRMMTIEAGLAVAAAHGRAAGGKSRRASCCIVPDSGYQQRLMQLHLLWREEQSLQEELTSSMPEVEQADEVGGFSLGFGRTQQHRNSTAMQQQQRLQLLQQQREAGLGAAAAAARRRRASMSLMPGSVYAQQQQQQQQHYMMQSQLSIASTAEPPALSRMRTEGIAAYTRHASMDLEISMEISRSSRAAARAALFSPNPLADQRLSPVPLQQQQAAAAAGYSRRPRRASVAIQSDSSHHAKLHALHMHMQMQMQMHTQQQQQMFVAEAAGRQQQSVSGGRRQRRESMGVLPSTYASDSSQQLSSNGAALRHSSIATDQGRTPFWHAAANGFASASSSGLESAAPAAARRLKGMSPQRSPSEAAAAAAASGRLHMPAELLAHASSGGSSSSMQGRLGPELAFSHGCSSANNSMDDSTGGFSEHPAVNNQQQQQMLLQRAQLGHSGDFVVATSNNSRRDIVPMLGAVRAGMGADRSPAQRARHAGSVQSVHCWHRSGSIVSNSTDDTIHPTDVRPASAASRRPSAGCSSGATPFAAAAHAAFCPDTAAAAGGSLGSSGDTLLTESLSEDQASALNSLQLLQDELMQLLDLKSRLAAAAAAAKAGTPAAAAVKAAQRKSAETIRQALAAQVALQAAAGGAVEQLQELRGRQGAVAAA